MATIKDLAERYGLEDYKQLLGGYPNAEKFITGLKDAAYRSVPTTEQMRDPNFIIDTAGLGGAIKAYHGTPHLFDRFDMSKIGTGEGAQAYGHGLYFAQDPNIANWYAQTLSEQPSDATLFLGKKPLNLNKIKDDEIQGEIQRIFDYIDDAKYPTDDLESFMQDISEKSKDDLRFYDPTDEEYKQLLYRQKLADALINHGRIEKISNPPHIYETSIEWPSAERETMDPLGEHHLLDWDKSLEDQSDYVKNILKEKNILQKYNKDSKVADVIFELQDAYPEDLKSFGISPENHSLRKEEFSKYLNKAGIPGLKYLDATSRGNDRDMRNYVMFGDEYPQIVKRANSLDELQEKYAKGGTVDKDSLQLNKPQRTPNHPTKSHIVKTMVDGKEKIIRFGEQGAETAGKPKEGESARMTAKREAFKARHAKNIAKGPSSAAYWADKVKWAKGGEVKALHDKYEQSDYGYGNRPDNTKKGLGYFGELVRPDGTGVMTEYSIGVPINGKEIDVPSLVPTLTPDEIRHILNMKEGENMPRSIVHKAIEHAHKRIDEGKPIFATEEDLYAHGGIVDVLHNDAIEQIMKAFKESMMDDEPTVSIEITTQNTESPRSGKIPTSIAREAKHGK